MLFCWSQGLALLNAHEFLHILLEQKCVRNGPCYLIDYISTFYMALLISFKFCTVWLYVSVCVNLITSISCFYVLINLIISIFPSNFWMHMIIALLLSWLLYFIVQDLQHFPRVDVKVKLHNEQERSKPPTLNIRLQLKNSRRSASRAFAPRFPKVSI